MKLHTAATWGSLLFCTALLPLATAATLDFPEYGFTIDSLDAKPSPGAATTAVMLFLPAFDGFAPNINVNIQPYPGSISDYVSLSKGQFEKMKWSIVSDKQTGDSEWKVEYKGPMQANDLHFYARALLKGGNVYLVTATAKEAQWAAVEKTLRARVDSFKAK